MATKVLVVDDEKIIVKGLTFSPVSYTHLRAHETGRNLVCRLLLEKKKKKIKKKKKKKFFFFFFFNDTATTEIYTLHIVGSVRCV